MRGIDAQGVLGEALFSPQKTRPRQAHKVVALQEGKPGIALAHWACFWEDRRGMGNLYFG
jgi:hypothetical protein